MRLQWNIRNYDRLKYMGHSFKTPSLGIADSRSHAKMTNLCETWSNLQGSGPNSFNILGGFRLINPVKSTNVNVLKCTQGL